MGNRKEMNSMAKFVRDAVAAGQTRDEIVQGIDDGLKSGVFKSKQAAKPIVRWYLNYFKKKLVVKKD